MTGMVFFKFSMIAGVILLSEIIERNRPGWGRFVLLVGCIGAAYAVFTGGRLYMTAEVPMARRARLRTRNGISDLWTSDLRFRISDLSISRFLRHHVPGDRLSLQLTFTVFGEHDASDPRDRPARWALRPAPPRRF